MLFVATYALVPGGALARISVAFAVAALADLAILDVLLARASHAGQADTRKSAPHPRADFGVEE